MTRFMFFRVFDTDSIAGAKRYLVCANYHMGRPYCSMRAHTDQLSEARTICDQINAAINQRANESDILLAQNYRKDDFYKIVY